MADAAAKREARRRRILENSEYRLQKITGQSNIEKIENNDEKHATPDPQPVISTFKKDGYSFSQDLVNSTWDDSLEIENQIIEENLQSCLLRKRNFSHETIPNAHENILASREDSRFLTKNTNDFVKNLTSMTGTEQATFSQTIFTKLLTNRLAYIILAGLVNLMIILNLERSYGISIIVPFFLVLISRFWICGSSTEMQGGNMLMAALILCNVRPDSIYRLKTTMNICSRIMKDFSIFIFSFALIYYTISRHWIDVDALLPNTVEIVVDRQTSN